MSTRGKDGDFSTVKKNKTELNVKGQNSVASYFKKTEKDENKNEEIASQQKKRLSVKFDENNSVVELSDGEDEVPYSNYAGRNSEEAHTISDDSSDVPMPNGSSNEKELPKLTFTKTPVRVDKTIVNSFYDIDDLFDDSAHDESVSKVKETVTTMCSSVNQMEMSDTEPETRESSKNHKHRKRKRMEDLFGENCENSDSETSKRKKSQDLFEDESRDSQTSNKRRPDVKNSLETLETTLANKHCDTSNMLNKKKSDPRQPSDGSRNCEEALAGPVDKVCDSSRDLETGEHSCTNSGRNHVKVKNLYSTTMSGKKAKEHNKSPSKEEKGKITDTVIKFLMPFYKKNRIFDKDLFKYLARTIVHKILLEQFLTGK